MALRRSRAGSPPADLGVPSPPPRSRTPRRMVRGGPGCVVRTVVGLFPALIDRVRLEDAARRTVRGKRARADVAWFVFRAEDEVRRLAGALATGEWRPWGFRRILLRDPKPRVLARAEVCDRVVHTALVDGLWTAFGPRLMPEDLACRPGGGGAHRALLILQRAMRRHRFCLHLDIRAYFPSIDVDLTHRLVAQRVRDPRWLDVLGRVLDAGRGLLDDAAARTFLGLDRSWPPPDRGLPLGAHTSQFLATHVVLNALDHHIKRQLKAPTYVRYVDDLFLFGDRRVDLRVWRSAIGAWLAKERGLRLKHPEAPVLACASTLHGLGHHVTRADVVPQRRARERLQQRVRRLLHQRTPAWRKGVARVMNASISVLRGPTG